MTKWRECTKPTCHELVQYPSKWCDKHQIEINNKRAEYRAEQSSKRQALYNRHNRSKEANSFYHTKQWQQTRNYVINRDHYICQVCGEPVNDRKIIDHIVPRRIDKSLELNTDNLWTLCYRCHRIKTLKEEQIINSPNGINKIKHLSKDRWIKYIKEFKQ